jgi:uncharacterized membrane-anchored protein
MMNTEVYAIIMVAIVAVCLALAIYRFSREPDKRTALRRNFLASLPMWLWVVVLSLTPKPYNLTFVWVGMTLAGGATLTIYLYLRKREH